jgi:hypothetical protein
MKFTEMLKSNAERIQESKETTKSAKTKIQEAKKPEEILRGNGYKIKLVTPTSFGTQIDFAKKYEDSEIEELLTDFTIKIKNNSVFIVS